VVDAAEVGDHHAILPTGKTPDPGRLSPDERRLFDLVARRFLAALSPDAWFDVTTLVVAVPPASRLPDPLVAPLRFRARGRVCRQAGWREVDPPAKGKEIDLPAVEQGAAASTVQARVVDGQTRPPRPFTDATLLGAMETAGRTLDDAELARAMRHAGLGTPATRAEIIKTLVIREYIARRGRDLRATPRGASLIDAVPDPLLKSAELTGRWEARLAAIAERREDRARFMADIHDQLRTVVAAFAGAPPPVLAGEAPPSGEPVGPCPRCGEPVREDRRGFCCSAGDACGFIVFKSMSGRAISARMVRQLLAHGQTPVVKGFKSKKTGKAFEAGLRIEEGRAAFWFPNDRRRSSSEPEASAVAAAPAPPEEVAPPGSPVGMACPSCGTGRLIEGRSAWGCARWRDGCRFTLAYEVDGRRLDPAEAVQRILEGVG
jgi:DNA topoisomerase-3